MDAKQLFKSAIEIKAINEFEWYLVQYDLNPKKFVRQIVKSHDLMWSEVLQSDNQEKEHVLIRDSGKLHLGYILYRAKNYADAIEQQKYMQLVCKHLLHSPKETNYFMENMHFNHNFWLIVTYSTLTVREEQSVLAIFHKNNVVLKKDNHSNNIIAYIQENESTYKGVVFKICNDISDVLFVMNIIRDDIIKSFEGNIVIDQKNQELYEEINHLEQRMHQESKLLVRAFDAVDKSKIKLLQRLTYLQNLADLNNVVD